MNQILAHTLPLGPAMNAEILAISLATAEDVLVEAEGYIMWDMPLYIWNNALQQPTRMEIG